MNRFLKILALFSLLALPLGLIATGCGDDDDNDGPGIVGPGPGSPDALSPDATDSDAGPGDLDADSADAVNEGDGSADVDEEQDQSGPFCDAIDLGVLAPDGSTDIVVDMADAKNRVQPSCSRGVARELIFKFSTERASRVAIRPTSAVVGDWVLQINQGSCGSSQEVACFEGGAQNIVTEGGKTYYLLLESATGASTGELKLALNSEALECYPAASSSCVDQETMQYCESDFQQTEVTCSLGCMDNACAGEYCDNQIPMDPSGSMRLEGSFDGYTSRFNMRNRSDCYDDGLSLPTAGPEILVALNDLSAGQLVRIDASPDVGDENDNVVFIVQDCGRTPVCLAGSDDEKYEWTVEEDGDYTLIIDTISTTPSNFAYEISIE